MVENIDGFGEIDGWFELIQGRISQCPGTGMDLDGFGWIWMEFNDHKYPRSGYKGTRTSTLPLM